MTTSDPTRKARIVPGTAFTGIAHIVKNEWFEQLVPEQLARWRKPVNLFRCLATRYPHVLKPDTLARPLAPAGFRGRARLLRRRRHLGVEIH